MTVVGILLMWVGAVAFAWLLVTETWRLYTDSQSNLNGTLDAWKRTIDDLEDVQQQLAAALCRIAELEAQREHEGEAWKL